MTRSTTMPVTGADGIAPGRLRLASTGIRGLGIVVAVAVLAGVVLASIAIGTKDFALGEVLDGLVDPDAPAHLIVHDQRIPRTVLGLLVGAALGVAGALIQGLTRNPLADPGILGVNAGATFSVAIGLTVFGASTISAQLGFAFVGALVVTVGVFIVGSVGGRAANPITLTLAGVAVAAVLTGITTALTLIDPKAFQDMRNWEVGSLAGRHLDIAATIAPFVLAGLVIAALMARPLDAVAMGDETAVSLGTRIVATRVLTIVAVTLLAGAATAAAGPIVFLGLVIPHVTRAITGPSQRWIITYCIVLAPTLLLVADIVGRVIIRPSEMPVGIVTAFIGAPVLIAIIRRANARAL